MGEHSDVIEPKNETEAALAQTAEQIVREIARDTPLVERSRFNLLELLALHEFGASRVGPRSLERWMAVFALAGSTGGIFCLRRGLDVRYLAVFWRTKNPHVNLAREIPKPEDGGNYAYIGWAWNAGKERRAELLLKRHILQECPGIEFVAWHDQRAKQRKARRGKLWVMEVGT